ncbi:hypothetical protein GCM10023168_26480 [Fodinibacter luteus]|uniref:Uncharacterized protein n=1 Tax=Fodinibacter luteus TaxID=552064 RepID=A0ABP8KKY7_9MICO
MRLLLPAPGLRPLFYEVNVSEEPAALSITGFNHSHGVVSQADVVPDGEFGVTSTLILGEDAVAVRIALSQSGGGLAAMEGTISGQPFAFVNTPSRRPQVARAPTLGESDTAVLGHWQPVARGLRILAFALRSYESIDEGWSASPCRLVLGAIAVGASAFRTADTDPQALDDYREAIRAADAWLVQGNCVDRVAPLSHLEPT